MSKRVTHPIQHTLPEVISREQPRNELMNLHPIKQQVYLSLMEQEAWRLYRQEGLPMTLLLDLYASERHYNRAIENMYRITLAFMRSPDYSSAAATLLREYAAVKKEFYGHGRPGAYGVEDFDAEPFMQHERLSALGLDPETPVVKTINQLGLSMMNIMYRSYQGLPFVMAITKPWFNVCDVALASYNQRAAR